MSEFFPTPDSCDAPTTASPLSLTIESDTIADICKQYRVSYTSIIDEWGREFYQFQETDGSTLLMILFSAKKERLLMNLNGVILPATEVSELLLCTQIKDNVIITGPTGTSYIIPNATVSLIMMALTVMTAV